MEVDITIPAQSVTIPSQEVSVTVPAAQIVYQNSWLNQSGSFSLTDIFSATNPEGLFRITGNVVAHGSGTFGLTAQFSYPTVNSANQFSSTQNGNYPISLLLSPAVGVPIQLSTVYMQGSIAYYDLYVTIEQLQ